MHKVKCLTCGKEFDRDKIPFIQIGRRYAHEKCPEEDIKNEKKLQEAIDKDQFYQMVKSIYGSDYNYMLINAQAEDYIQQYGYTWSGMTGCLHWFYNINHGNIEEGHGGIGIIPFIYNQVRDYYMKLDKTQQENKKIQMRREVINFNIQSPRAWHRPPRLLDIEEDNK